MKIAILASGRGSNMESILQSVKQKMIPATVALVLSDKSTSISLSRAADMGIPNTYIDPLGFKNREEYDREIVRVLKDEGIELICLAGYMRILSPFFVKSFPGHILNIHPALLPSFPGLHAQKQAFEYGVKISGATVHFIDEGVDTGPIIMQGAVSVDDTDTVESLSEKILKEEHRIYPLAIKAVAEKSVSLLNGKVVIGIPGNCTGANPN